MNKKFLNVLVLVTAVLAMAALSSCSKDDDPSEESTPSKTEDTHTYVDLGLTSGTKWADRNIGAETVDNYGGYFAWGETVPYGKEDKTNLRNYAYTDNTSYTKIKFNEYTYKYGDGTSSFLMTKYCTNSKYGTPDNKSALELMDDAAYVNWGSNWRMPTKEQFQELRDECTWVWTSVNGVIGYRIEGKNGRTIFLPAAGYRNEANCSESGVSGCYWTSTLGSQTSKYACSFDYVYNSSSSDWKSGKVTEESRRLGHSIRAVYAK